LFSASPKTVNVAAFGRNDAVTAAFADGLAASKAAAPSTTPATSRRAAPRQVLMAVAFISWAPSSALTWAKGTNAKKLCAQ
jgi:hypothetical protein